MRKSFLAACLLAFAAPLAWSDDPSPRVAKSKAATPVKLAVAVNPVQPYHMARVSVNAEDGDSVTWEVSPEPTDTLDTAPGLYVFTGVPGTRYAVTADLLNFDTRRRARKTITVTFAGLPQPPPGPPPPGPQPPGPQPPPPAPVPVSTFRVILVYESAGFTPEQKAVVFGRQVSDWLDANCTGGPTGWRRRDKDQVGDLDPTLAELWKAVQPAVKNVPCVAVERNGVVELVNVEPTQAAMLDVLKRYREGR